MKRIIVCALLALTAVLPSRADAEAPLKVITSTEDLSSLVQEIGGDKVTVEAIARGYQDPHFVEAKPSFVIKLHGADLLVVVARELEAGWLPPLITQSRNAKIQVGGPAYLDASLTARIVDLPTGQITRAMGDVHPQGNPHYWLDPGNGRRIAKAIQNKLTELSSGDAAYFAARHADFDKRLGEAEKRWQTAIAPYKGLKIVTYHRSWSNFAEVFGLDVVGYVEPKPGIPPSPAHQLALTQEMKRLGIKIILVEPYFDLQTPNKIARDTGAKVLVMPPSVGGVKEVKTYIQLFDYDINLLTSAIKQSGASVAGH
jgi:zinc/manganese transport system substrate-binding protein